MDTKTENQNSNLLIYYIGGYLFVSAILFYFGTIISRKIENLIAYGLFWMIYLITFITLGNSLFNYYSYKTLSNKDGLRGNQGYPGLEGDKGDEADCDKNCKLKNFSSVILNKLNVEYNKILEIGRGRKIEPSRKIKNSYIIDTIKRICDSKQFKQVSQLRHPTKLIDYIAETFIKWINLIAKADLSEDKKHFQDYMEIYGEQREWEALIKSEDNPFHEIEKYDIYYWGLDKEFHPIKIKSCLKSTEKNKKKPIRAIKTNMYERKYYDKGTGAKFDFSIWMSDPLKIQDEIYYPLGAVSLCHWSAKPNKKNVEFLGDKSFKFDINSNGKKFTSPRYSNILVAGDNKSVRKPPASAWKWRYNDQKTGGKFPVTMWNAEDFQEDGELFRCFGSMTMSNYKGNPTEQLGRDKVPMVCVNDKLLDEIPNKHNFVYDDRKSGGRYDLEVYANLDGDYNLTYFREGNWRKGIRGPDLTRKMYKLKDEYVKESKDPRNIPVETLHNLEDDGYAVGFQETKYEQDRKGSLFDLLDLVVKSPLQNMFQNQKLFLEHSKLNNPNSYLIKEYNKKTGETDKCLKINESGNSYTVTTCNPTQDKQLWEIEFLGQSKEMCLVKSLQNSKYLFSKKPYLYQLSGDLPSRNIKDENLKPYMWRILSSNK